MLLKALGWLWIILGGFFLFFPERFRNYLKNKATKKVRRFLFAIAFAIGGTFIKASWDYEGWLANILLLLGVLAIIKAFIFLKKQAAERLIDWFVSWPVNALRAGAIVEIAFGVFLVYFDKI